MHSALNIGRESEPAESLIETLTDQVCDHVTESLEAVQGTIERRIIVRVLKKTGGNQTQAARLLGIKRTTLSYKIKKLKIVID
jgi:DNA-binding protein Fis